ncbi:hypothetical protein BD413DRAFT_599154 [Trametes elegans]|nr:hypothetical protein BD413DRAFT_599154 [Trametes elegans]
MTLLVGRLLWYDKEIWRYRIKGRRSLSRRVARTIVQSEALHSIMVVMNLAAYAARSNLVVVTANALPPLIGISFTLIITHFGLYELTERARDQHVPTLYVDVEMPPPVLHISAWTDGPSSVCLS